MPGVGNDGWVNRLRAPPAGDDGPDNGDLSGDSSDEDLFEVSDNDADEVKDPAAAVANEPQPQDERWGRCGVTRLPGEERQRRCAVWREHPERVDQSKLGCEPQLTAESSCGRSRNPAKPAASPSIQLSGPPRFTHS